ncbi:ImmA/IrrE family metallo-endopeptidase [Frigidibacter sp. RF13]|uniref:ImmA/IrrE family metallo-endopeptidase n=1 Tax=Frigidibacter sp. RF13 TaxID=2997340 RepID=UPI002271F304|nr:ImmA/IrrE family metallo-endopeptidase [Frigidibacter sp. RF13]MCY1126576.1 ImmA/IrrE family metallo-endopeptidase [Frigidibacter sp. RF13]
MTIDPDDYLVPPMKWSQIDARAAALRDMLKVGNTPYLDVVRIVENVLCNLMEVAEFQIGTKQEMGRAEGLTCPQGTFIRFREDVYERACEGDGRARFTFAHELGHLALHKNAPMARASKRDGTRAYMLAEPQANRFAAALLMPRAHIFAPDESADLMTRFGVSWEAASNRLSDLKNKGEL